MWDLIVSVPDHCLSFYFSYEPFRGSVVDKSHKYMFLFILGIKRMKYHYDARSNLFYECKRCLGYKAVFPSGILVRRERAGYLFSLLF